MATTRSITISPRKVRLVADSVRTLPLTKALHILSFTKKRAARPLAKTLRSAIANAINNKHVSEETLRLKNVEVMEGPVMKRFRAISRGQAHAYKKRMTHIRVTLTDEGAKRV